MHSIKMILMKLSKFFLCFNLAWFRICFRGLGGFFFDVSLGRFFLFCCFCGGFLVVVVVFFEGDGGFFP